MKTTKPRPQIKKRGRPKKGEVPAGKDPLMAFRAPDSLREEIDGWAAKQPGKPPRSEAIRTLIEKALKK